MKSMIAEKYGRRTADSVNTNGDVLTGVLDRFNGVLAFFNVRLGHCEC